MPARCFKCEVELTPDRCIAMINMSVPLDQWSCTKCSPVQKPFGVMCPGDAGAGGKTYGKTGAVLMTINPSDKEMMRRAKRFIRRAR